MFVSGLPLRSLRCVLGTFGLRLRVLLLALRCFGCALLGVALSLLVRRRHILGVRRWCISPTRI